MFYLILLLPIISVVLLFAVKNIVDISIEGNEVVHKEESGLLYLNIKNKSFLPIVKGLCQIKIINKLTSETKTEVIQFSLSSRTKETIEIITASNQCGIVELQVLDVTFYDYLMLYRVTTPVKKCANLVVLPNMYDINLNTNNFIGKEKDYTTSSSQKSGLDANEVLSLKEYSPGDSVKQIHWKLSAKLDTLMIQELSETTDDSILILMETFLPLQQLNNKSIVLDAMIETYTSLTNHFISNQKAITIGWYDGDINQFLYKRITSKQQLTTFVKDILKIKFIQQDYATLTYLAQENSSFSIVYFVTTEQANVTDATELFNDKVTYKTVYCESLQSFDRVMNEVSINERRARTGELFV